MSAERQFKAREVPLSTKQNKFAMLQQEMEARRRMNVAARKEELEKSAQPFQGVLERTEESKAKWEARVKAIDAEREAQEKVTTTFKVPLHAAS